MRERGERERRRERGGRRGEKRGRGELHFTTPFLVNKECKLSFLNLGEMQTGDPCTCTYSKKKVQA